MKPVIEVCDLHKSYGATERVHGISFSVSKGQIFGFLGVNGAGKTTTIEILEGYRARDSGDVAVLGTDPWRAPRTWRNRIGLVLQDSMLNPVFSVRETVSMFARYFVATTSVDHVLRACGLSDQSDERIGRLSGGQRRKVDVALGLVGDPEILFLDEPTTGLDPAARREMWTVIGGLREAEKTVFLTTHYMDEAQHLSDEIVILRAGSIVAQGSPDQLSRSLGAASQISFELPTGVPLDSIELPITTARCESGTVRFQSVAVQRDLGALLAWAQSERIELANLTVKQPSLDDVFVQLATWSEDDLRLSESSVADE
ncbi:MAG: ABC transporter ATP-binding protein [Acidimicrobiales bacterium]